MKLKQFVKEIMSRNVETIGPEASVREAARLMKRLGHCFLPVLDEDRKVIGTLRDHEIVCNVVAEGLDPDTTRVRDVMNTDVVSCSEDDDAGAAERLMEKKKVRKVLVVDSGFRLVGLVSLGKLARTRGDKQAGRIIQRMSRPHGRLARGTHPS